MELLLSGLAGGVIGGAHFAREAPFQQAITVDMGVTSCDVELLLEADPHSPPTTRTSGGLPVAIPVIEARTLGAGGGSIARIDKGGMLAVGPESAGARPRLLRRRRRSRHRDRRQPGAGPAPLDRSPEPSIKLASSSRTSSSTLDLPDSPRRE